MEGVLRGLPTPRFVWDPTDLGYSGGLSVGATPVGSIVMWAGSSSPEGWLICAGQTLSRSAYSELYDAIGTAYGAPSSSTFQIPNLQGRFPVGYNATDSDFNLRGKTGGAKTHTHSAHSHGAGSLSATANTAWTNVDTTPISSVASYNHGHTISGSTGNDTPAATDHKPPYIAMNWIIKVKSAIDIAQIDSDGGEGPQYLLAWGHSATDGVSSTPSSRYTFHASGNGGAVFQPFYVPNTIEVVDYDLYDAGSATSSVDVGIFRAEGTTLRYVAGSYGSSAISGGPAWTAVAPTGGNFILYRGLYYVGVRCTHTTTSFGGGQVGNTGVGGQTSTAFYANPNVVTSMAADITGIEFTTNYAGAAAFYLVLLKTKTLGRSTW